MKLQGFQNVTPQAFNQLVDAVNRAAHVTASPPLEVTRTNGGTQIRLIDQGFMASIVRRTPENRLCSSSSSSSVPAGTIPKATTYTYLVREVFPLVNGLWEYADGGREVVCTEWNDNKVDVDTVVHVLQFGEQDFRFEHCCSLSDTPCSSSSRSSSSVSSSSQSLSSASSSSVSSVSSSSTSSLSLSSSSSRSSSSSSSVSSSSVSSSSVSSVSSSSVSLSSASSSSQSDSSQSQSSQSQSSQSDSSQSCGGTLLTFISGLSFNSGTCTLTVTQESICLPSCINVQIVGG